MAQQLHQASFFLLNMTHTPSVTLVSEDVFLITTDSHTCLLVLLLLMNMQHAFQGAYVLCLHSLCIELHHIQIREGSLWQAVLGRGQRRRASHWPLGLIFFFFSLAF